MVEPIKGPRGGERFELDFDTEGASLNVVYAEKEQAIVVLHRMPSGHYETMHAYCGKFAVEQGAVLDCYLLGEAGKVPWSITLQLPEQALYERSGQSVPVNQFGRPVCLLGRVENRRSLRSLEICASNSWIDASPIGRGTSAGLWSLEVFKPVGATSESFGHLEDVVLELSVVGVPRSNEA